MTVPVWFVALFAVVTIAAPILYAWGYRNGARDGNRDGYRDGVRSERSAWANAAPEDHDDSLFARYHAPR